MKVIAILFSCALMVVVRSQTTFTLSGCHTHGRIEYCYLPNGTETPWTTRSEPMTPTPTASATSTATTEATVLVSGCHFHEETQFCMVSGAEYEVTSQVDMANASDSYSGCHFHKADIHCAGAEGEVTLAATRSASEVEGHDHTSEHTSNAANADGVSCHFHAGVEHCVDTHGNTVEGSCARPERDYNIPLRAGLLFVIVITSAIGVFAPVLTSRFTGFNHDHILLVAMRQFGTGIIISTAIVHLFTHAQLYFSNECLGGVDYEATAGAILMAGLFLTFLVEVVAHRWSDHRRHECSQSPAADRTGKDAESAYTGTPQSDNIMVKTTVMEAGIIFHSILIGITLVVAGDSGFITLFIVILFHQVFEGLALGSRIAMIPSGLLRKLLLGLAFAITTPIGMAIGIGVLSSFNGNDPSTIIAIGTLNAFSAGILLWVGVVEMWFVEWFQGPLANAGLIKSGICMLTLVSGLVVMSVLGKWA